jgi:hypothetical protein
VSKHFANGKKNTYRGAEHPLGTIVDVQAPGEAPSPSPSITRRRTPAALAVGVHSFQGIQPRFPPPWSVGELETCFVVTASGRSLVESLRLIQMRSSAFSFEGAPVVSIIVLMAANAVRFRCA